MRPFITITTGIGVYYAVLMTWDEDMGFHTILYTGIGRYRTREEAMKEAREWAISESIEYR